MDTHARNNLLLKGQVIPVSMPCFGKGPPGSHPTPSSTIYAHACLPAPRCATAKGAPQNKASRWGGLCCYQGNSIATLYQTVGSRALQELEGEEGACIPLQPGQATLHHIRLAHRSGPAAPDSCPRLGIALRYMAAHVQQDLDHRDSVTVVAGRDTFQLYCLERRPAAEMDAAALQEYRTAVVPVYPPGFERGNED